MKKIVLLLFVMISSMAIAQEQDAPAKLKGGPGPGIENHVKDLKDKLNLNEGQAAKVKKLFEQRKAAMDAERAEYKRTGTRPDPATLKEKRDKENKAVEAEMQKILTKEQFDKWRSLEHQRGGKPQKSMQQ